MEANKNPDAEKREYIKNLWFLMLYASYFNYKGKDYKAGKEENPDELATMIAEILLKAVALRLRRNLNLSYEPRQEVLRRVRGRIDLLKTERNQLLQKGQVACRFEELTIDTPRNRFVRDALEKIAQKVSQKSKKKADKKIANNCRELVLRLRQAGVTGIAPTYRQLENQRFGRNDKNDEEMVFAAKLAFNLALPDESAGSNELFLPNYKGKFYNLYEKAITNFYKIVLSSEEWQVLKQNKITWEAIEHDDDARSLLPNMYADIILNKKDKSKSIVIDTKFKEIVKKDTRYGDDENKRLRSSDIYQIYTYLVSQKDKTDSRIKYKAEGLLLYPVLSKDEKDKIDKTFYLGDFKVRFATIDLQEDVLTIRKNLKEIIDPS